MELWSKFEQFFLSIVLPKFLIKMNIEKYYEDILSNEAIYGIWVKIRLLKYSLELTKECWGKGVIYTTEKLHKVTENTGEVIKKKFWTIWHLQLKFNPFKRENWNSNTLPVVGRVFANGPGDRGSIPGRVIPKIKRKKKKKKKDIWYHLA